MANVTATKYTHRFLARFVIEAKTPLAVGSGEKDIITDALVATDVNGLPYIPATAIAGVVRSMIENVMPEKDDMGISIAEHIFGYQETKEQKELRKGKDKNSKDSSKGSEIIFTEAKILNHKGEVIDGLNLDALSDTLLEHYKDLPIRQHVKINHKGVTDKAGKFDEQVVFAGTRFCFEMEMVSDGNNYDKFEEVIKQLNSKTFRIGSGTRCGFGEIEVKSLKTRKLNLKDDLDLYLSKESDLSEDWNGWEDGDTTNADTSTWTEYTLNLEPEDFFLFGSGFGDDDVDMTPVREKKVKWENGKGKIEDNFTLIPATSVKGALSHRVAFHYNKLNGKFADNLTEDERKAIVGKNNKAVAELFGSEGERDGDKNKGQARGKVIFSDIIEKKLTDKILNHVSIDRFTGGAIEGALFSEKTTYGKGENFTMSIYVDYTTIEDKDKKNIRTAFENALGDICKGMLPLGGGVNRGNGVFTGTIKCNGEIIYSNNGGNK